jgi:hypothetical protein
MTITIEIQIIWFIKGIDNYGFGNDNYLYNLIRCKRIKQSMNNGSIGYWLGKKFYSLNKLKPLLYKKRHIILPF